MISGKVIGQETEKVGTIKITAEYTLADNSKVNQIIRYMTQNFSAYAVQRAIQAKCEELMRREYCKNQNEELIKTDLSKVMYECSSVDFIIKPEIKDMNGNIVQAREVITVSDIPTKTP